VQEAVSSSLSAWESFYVIVGSSAAALTGLQFVVMALVAEAEKRSTTSEVDAFSTPTVVHFCAVLLVSAILSAPWNVLTSPGRALGVCGLMGMGYSVLIVRRARRQRGYRLVLEDWLWYLVLPSLAYTGILVAAVAVMRHSTDALFVIGAMALLLLFIGIHNAWDTVTFVAVERLRAMGQPPESS
jgi:hypothetical protein